MVVHAIKCYKCGDIIYSRCQRDCHYCSCNTCYVDDGPGVGRMGAPDIEKVERTIVHLDAHYEDLFNDWNDWGEGKYGLVEGPDTPKRRKAVAKALLKS